MIPIITLQMFYRTNAGNVEKIEVEPTAQDIGHIKLDTARLVRGLVERGDVEYYYLVVKVRKSNGEFGYRTMIPKTLL